MARTLSVLILVVAAAGCGAKPREASNAPLDQSAAPTAGDQLTGPVQEHLNAPPYVYLGIKTPKGDVWAAVPQSRIENGTDVTIVNPMRMTDFESTSLKRTFAEVWAQQANLDGKTVPVRGVVVKYNGGVMGKNWLHLQDGSGNAGQGTNDITVTSLDEAAKGDTVTIRETVRTNKDFGAGYTYPMMVEDAKVLARSGQAPPRA